MACGVASHVPVQTTAVESAAAPVAMSVIAAGPGRFAALRQPDCRRYLIGCMLSMMADNVEHVITYWVLWLKFHSPALTGFEVISHWLPFLLCSVWFGGLADRHDCRRVIQAAQALFMSVSIAWGVLFLTGVLQIWHACVLLVLHGLAGALWGPAEQLMLHDFVGPEGLPSAIRLNATFRNLGLLLGPVVGSALLLGLGPVPGIFANAAIYLPLTCILLTTSHTGHARDRTTSSARVGVREALRTIAELRANSTVVAMIALGGLASFFGAASLQSTMPIFAHDVGASAGLAYGVLLFSTGVGGVVGGLLLEVTGRLRPTVATATWTTFALGGSLIVFASTRMYPLAILALFLSGVASLASMSIGQTLVQLLAPPGQRGRVVGVYGMSANGLRTGNGIAVGVLGAAAGVHWSLGVSAACLCVGSLGVIAYLRRVGAGGQLDSSAAPG